MHAQEHKSKRPQPVEGKRAETVTPWGLSRMTNRLPVAPLPYETFEFDPTTQLTNFYDASGAIVDMGKGGSSRSYKTISMSRDGDGSKNAPQVADDDNNDIDKD
ncbi:putative ATP-grasp-modified RiPP [Streptosporangium subroseum]|uniref:putative ATP-grasp-modified RiPP n=1 Tax=Streptosporangium subroseum TaxID=106412 RepID=UPI003432A778